MTTENKFISLVSNLVEPLLSTKDSAQNPTLWVAYSGGVDSTVLLHTAAAYAKNNPVHLKAIHINHDLSPNAQHWQQHCVDECQKLGVDLVVKSVQLLDEGKGLEASARKARYTAIAQETSPQDLILLGQHQNDQVETFLLQLLRGAGPTGLSGMEQSSVNEYGSHLLRPFLSISREVLHREAAQNQWSWIEDESNQNNDFDRNYLRNEIVPTLRERWGSADSSISRSISHIREQQELLNEVVAKELSCILGDRQQINVAGLIAHSFAWQKQILKYWITQQKAQQPSEKVLERILKDCIYAREDAQPSVTWARWQCCRFAGELYLLPQLKDLSGRRLTLRPGDTIDLPDGLGSYSISHVDDGSKPGLLIDPNATIEIRFGGFTQRFKPEGERYSKPLNQWFKQWKIPPWERLRVPCLLVDSELVAVGERLNQNANTPGANKVVLQIAWLKN